MNVRRKRILFIRFHKNTEQCERASVLLDRLAGLPNVLRDHVYEILCVD